MDVLSTMIFSAVVGVIGALILRAIKKEENFVGLNEALFLALIMSGVYALLDMHPAISVLKGFILVGAWTLATNYLILRSTKSGP